MRLTRNRAVTLAVGALCLAASLVAGAGQDSPRVGWSKVCDGSYLPGYMGRAEVVFVPTFFELLPLPEEPEASESPSGTQDEWVSLSVDGGLLSVSYVGSGTLDSGGAAGGLAPQVAPGAEWLPRAVAAPPLSVKVKDGEVIHARPVVLGQGGGSRAWCVETPDGLRFAWADCPGGPLSPSGELLASLDSLGSPVLVGPDGLTRPIAFSRPSARQWADWAWAPDGSGTFMVAPGEDGVEAWWCPLEGPPEILAHLAPDFGWIVGAREGSVLVWQTSGEVLELTRGGTAVRPAPSEGAEPVGVSPDGRYLLWYSGGLVLSDLGDGSEVPLSLPAGYEAVPPTGWPGTTDQLAVFAVGTDLTDTLLVVYDLTGDTANPIVIPPTRPGVAFDYGVQPTFLRTGLLSVVTIDRDSLKLLRPTGSQTWLVNVSGSQGGGN